MSRIGNIHLIWRKGRGSRRIPVGIIKRNSTQGARFQYLEDNLDEATSEGFLPFPGFPDTQKVYTENVLDIFAQRLAKLERNDLSGFYDFWKVDPERKEDPYYMLTQTQGLLPIDNFEFLADFNPMKGLNFVTEIAGLSKTQLPAEKLKIGDKLSYKLEKQNSIDNNAVQLFKDGLLLGYVKQVHSKVFHRYTKGIIDVTVHHIEKNGVLRRVFIEVLLK